MKKSEVIKNAWGPLWEGFEADVKKYALSNNGAVPVSEMHHDMQLKDRGWRIIIPGGDIVCEHRGIEKIPCLIPVELTGLASNNGWLPLSHGRDSGKLYFVQFKSGMVRIARANGRCFVTTEGRIVQDVIAFQCIRYPEKALYNETEDGNDN